jgi:predicted phosphodiesterase
MWLFSAGVQAKTCRSARKFDDKHIVLSIGAISDTHIDGRTANSAKFRNALRQLNAKAAEQDGNGLDGVMVVGDIIDNGMNKKQIRVFKNDYEAVLDPVKVPMIYTVGNHDPGTRYRWYPDTPAKTKFIRDTLGTDYFRTDLEDGMRNKYECRHCVIGGYHILSVTPDGASPVTYPDTVVKWLDARLKMITKEDPGKYVIVITHPMIYDTVYGSLLGTTDSSPWKSSLKWYWSTKALTGVLDKYPQAVTFSGHLHFPLNDPRSIWQGKFTALGCGSVSYASIEPGDYEEMPSSCVPKDARKFSQGLLVQFDAKGNMRVTRMDFYNNAAIGKPWIIPHPVKNRSNLKVYMTERRKAADKAPVLGNITVIQTDIAGKGKSVSVTFASGIDDEFVHHYVLTLKEGDKVVAVRNILSDFYLHPQPSEMKTSWTRTLGILASGTYTVSLAAYDSWDKKSNVVTSNFTVL